MRGFSQPRAIAVDQRGKGPIRALVIPGIKTGRAGQIGFIQQGGRVGGKCRQRGGNLLIGRASVKPQTRLRQGMALLCRQGIVGQQRGKKLTEAPGVVRDEAVFLLTILMRFNGLKLQGGQLLIEEALFSRFVHGCGSRILQVIPLRVVGKIDIPGAGNIRWFRLHGQSEGFGFAQQTQQVIARVVAGRQHRIAFQQTVLIAPLAVFHIKRGECRCGARQ